MHYQVNLALIPRREGSILIKGIHYTFGNLVHTFRPIHKKGKRLNNTLEQRRSVCYAPDYTLDILVTSPMPLLDLTFHGVPETILSGEVVQTVLEINNKGNKGLTALRVKSSHPSFFCIGNPEEMDKEVYGKDNCFRCISELKLIQPLQQPHRRKTIAKSFRSITRFTILVWYRSHCLQAKTDRVRQVLLAPARPLLYLFGFAVIVLASTRSSSSFPISQRHVFSCLLLSSLLSAHVDLNIYTQEDNAAIAHRTVRYTINLQVLPSLKINAFTRPSAASTNEYILGIEVKRKNHSGSAKTSLVLTDFLLDREPADRCRISVNSTYYSKSLVDDNTTQHTNELKVCSRLRVACLCGIYQESILQPRYPGKNFDSTKANYFCVLQDS